MYTNRTASWWFNRSNLTTATHRNTKILHSYGNGNGKTAKMYDYAMTWKGVRTKLGFEKTK